MRILVACEFSDRVRSAFEKRGHEAWSCDLLPSENKDNKKHYQGDVFDIINDGWDMMIAHPPCTYICIANAPHYSIKKYGPRMVKERRINQIDAIVFFKKLLEAGIKKVCVENPKPLTILTNEVGKYTQVIQPYFFGNPESKTTCLWLRGLPELKPTNIVPRGKMVTRPGGRTSPEWLHMLPNNKDRWKVKSRTFQGIADAMAEQWG